MTLAHATVEELREVSEAATSGVGWHMRATAIARLRQLLTPTTVLALLDRLERAERHVDPANVIEMLRFMGHDRAAELVHSSFVAEVTPRAALDDEAPR